jgi:hypothetical protein
MRRVVLVALALSLVPVAGAGEPASAGRHRVPAVDRSPAFWHARVRSVKRYAARRRGRVAFAVIVRGRLYGSRWREATRTMSVVKAMLLVAYLNRRSVRHRALHRHDKNLLAPMVRWSDNAAASRVDGIVGNAGLRRVARRVRMRRFVPRAGIWGYSQICAEDGARLMLRIDRLVPARHRRYALALLHSIVPSQRWGVARARPRGWRLYFKGGWGSGTGAFDHQIALLISGRRRVGLAIMTEAQGSHAYGKATLRRVARRLLRGL